MEPKSTFLAIHRYKPAAWLRVTGSDAPGFLQGQFTNDLRALEREPAVYGLWLDQKGKTVADSFVLKGPDPGSFCLASYFSPGDVIRRRLEGYIIADDVMVEDLGSAWAAISLVGEGADQWRPGQAALPGRLFRGRRGQPGWEWIFPVDQADAVAPFTGGMAELTALEMERARILAGIPAVPRDVGPGDLPNEGGLQEAAISYSKGCYLGQEIMARLKSRGNVRRRLMEVRGSGLPPEAPARLWQGDRAAGELRSAAQEASGTAFVGLAMMTMGGLKKDLPLATAPGGTPAMQIVNSC